MKTDLRLIREDVTSFWDEELRKKHNVIKVFDYFLVNKNQAVYLCELTASIERWPYHSEFIGMNDDPVTEEAWEEFYQHNHTENDYVHFNQVEGARELDMNFEYETNDEYNEEMESVVDYLMGDPITW